MTERSEWHRALAERPGERRRSIALGLSIAGGFLGLDRFYMGQVPLGILKLLTFGLCGIWWVADVVLIGLGHARDADGQKLG